MKEKKMGMRAVLTRLLGIATVACALVATPAVASAETQVMPDGVKAEVLPLTQANNEPVQITEPGSYVLKTAEGEVTPSSGYTIDAPDASRINPVRIYIDGTVYVNDKTNWRVEQTRWLFNIKQGSNIEFIGVNNPCVSFHRNQKQFESVSGFLTDRYYSGGYKKASGDISVSLGVGDGSQNFILSYGSKYEQKVPAISLGSTEGKLTAKFEKMKIQGYVGKSGAVAGNAQEYAVPVHLFREGRDTTGGNTNSFAATFTDCVFYDTSGDFNGAVSVDGNSSFKMPKDGSAVAKLTATFNNCSFTGSNGENLGVRQTNNSYESVEGDLGQNLGPNLGPGGSPMYTKEEREGILWEFHRSGLSAPAACRSLPLFPNKDNLYAWLKLEEAGELTAREMPGRAERMHCSHGEGSPAFAARRAGAAPASPRKRRAEGGAGRMKGTGRGGAGGEPPMQTDWRDWGLEGLPDDPAERAREAEVRLAEALAVLDVLKAPGPGSLTNEEKHRAGEAARRLSPAVRLADVTRTLSIPKSTYLDQASRISRPDPKAALRERVRASFEASGGAYGPESVTADLRRGPGEPVSWRALAPGDAETPVVASEKVVRRIMREEGLVARKAAQMRRRARYCSYRGELAERPANVPLRGDGTHDFRAAAPGLLVVTDVTEFRLDGYRAYLSPAIDCFDGWPICWRVSVHADSDLMVGMLRDLVGIVGPTEGRPLTVHTDGGAVYMGREWREACGPGVVRSMSRRARSPDNACAEGFFGTLKCDFFEGRDWTGVPFDEFSRLLGEYIEWYRDGKLKKDLGWKTIREYREERGYAA